MKKVLLLTLLSSFILADSMMDGWNNSEDEEAAKAQKEEQIRMCTLYTKKIKNIKRLCVMMRWHRLHSIIM